MQTSEKFSNQVILPDQLAPIENQAFESLEAKLKLVKIVNASIFLAFALIAFFILAYISTNTPPISVFIGIPLFFIFLFMWKLTLVLLGFPKKGYLLREQDLSYRRGLLMYTLTTIPFNRIQHVEVSQSMIEKAFGLSSIKLFTAGGSVSDLSIPGLLPEKAHQIESFLLSKVNKHE